jgi:prepilin-type processing-associated H-X9-DG protein
MNVSNGWSLNTANTYLTTPSLFSTCGSCSTTADGIAPYLRHNNGGNYGFVDGHAKWLTPGQIGSTATLSTDPTTPVAGSFAAWLLPKG